MKTLGAVCRTCQERWLIGSDGKRESKDPVPSQHDLRMIFKDFPVSWVCRVHRLQDHPTNECPVYDTKQSDSEVPVMLELCWIQSTPSLPSISGPLWPGVVAPDKVLSMGQIELNCVLMLHWIAWNRTVLTFKLHTYTKLNCLKW